MSIIKDLQFLNEENRQIGALALKNMAKTGKMKKHSLETEMADRYIYEAYKPYLEKQGISKKDFFNNPQIISECRAKYLQTLNKVNANKDLLYKNHPIIFSSTNDVNIDQFTGFLQEVNQDWLEFQKRLKENLSTDKFIENLRNQVTYTGFLAAETSLRKRMLLAARDQNRDQAIAIFNCLKDYIMITEEVDYQTYIDNSELRGLYKKKYLGLKEQLEETKNKAKLSDETIDTALQRISKKWSTGAKDAKAISELAYEQFAVNYPIEKFATLSPEEIERINQKILSDRIKVYDLTHQQSNMEIIRENQQLDALNQRFNVSVNESYRQAATEQMKKHQDFNTLFNEMWEQENSSIEAPRKK